MDPLLALIIGLVIGVVLGAVIGMLLVRSRRTDTTIIAERAASAEATVAAQREQIETLSTQIRSDRERTESESRRWPPSKTR
ncbi:MAG: hypothetical protein V4479_08415 [Actinomycetota bacterium]